MQVFQTSISPSLTTTPVNFRSKKDVTGFWIGVGLSVASSLFIGASFVIKKQALLRLRNEGKRANQGGFGYLRDIKWWSGLICMALGEM